MIYSKKAVRLQGGTLIYTFLVYNLLSTCIGAKSLALMTAIKHI